MKIRELTADELYVDHDVQRDLPVSSKEAIARKWDREKTGVLYGSLRSDGLVYLIDGQTRRAAAAEVDPDFTLTVMVHESLSKEQEARLFLAYNEDRKTIRAHDKFRIKAEAGMSPHKETLIALSDLGIHIGGSASANVIASAATLEWLAKFNNGISVIQRTVSVIKASFPHEEDRWRQSLLVAVGLMYRKSDETGVPIRFDRLVETLRRYLPEVWEQKGATRAAKEAASNRAHSGRADHTARCIAEVYNNRLGQDSRIVF
jgi:hypothetical protein